MEKCINCHKEVSLVSFRLHMSSCPGWSSKSAGDQTDNSCEISVISVPKTGKFTAGGINGTAKCTNDTTSNISGNILFSYFC